MNTSSKWAITLFLTILIQAGIAFANPALPQVTINPDGTYQGEGPLDHPDWSKDPKLTDAQALALYKAEYDTDGQQRREDTVFALAEAADTLTALGVKSDLNPIVRLLMHGHPWIFVGAKLVQTVVTITKMNHLHHDHTNGVSKAGAAPYILGGAAVVNVLSH